MQKLMSSLWIGSLCALLRRVVLPLMALSFAAYAAHATTVSINANPVSVTSGATSTLTWTSSGATICAASGAWSGVKAISGSRSVVAPNGLNTYILNCSGPTGSASSSVVIGAGTPAPPVYALNVTLSGSGTVTSNPSGINCGATCSANYPSGAAVSLSATPATGYTFSGWSGACSGSGACVAAMNANRAVTATFINNTTQILFEERFDNPGNNLTYGFDGWLFGQTNRPWTREHLLTGGVNNGPAFRATSTFDSLNDGGGASYYFLKFFNGNLANNSRDFWVRQCMKYSAGYNDARTMFPSNPKINYFIGDGGGWVEYTPISGTFRPGERVIGQNSGARADFFLPFKNRVSRSTNVVGTFQAGETLVGQTSQARATFVSFLDEPRTIGFNHFWHPGGTEEWRGGGYQELTWYDVASDHYFGSNNPVNQVRHSNWLLLQDHYDEWMCMETHIDTDQVPWLAEIYVTTAPGAATLAPGTTALDTNGRRQFNDYLYIRYSNPYAVALEPGFGVDHNEYGAYGGALPGDQLYFDEMVISTGKVGHPFR